MRERKFPDSPKSELAREKWQKQKLVPTPPCYCVAKRSSKLDPGRDRPDLDDG